MTFPALVFQYRKTPGHNKLVAIEIKRSSTPGLNGAFGMHIKTWIANVVLLFIPAMRSGQ